jgi:hypothetical protein
MNSEEEIEALTKSIKDNQELYEKELLKMLSYRKEDI